ASGSGSRASRGSRCPSRTVGRARSITSIGDGGRRWAAARPETRLTRPRRCTNTRNLRFMKTITEFSGSVLRDAARILLQRAPSDEELAALGLAGDRLARMNEALAVVGDKVDEVHRVRVLQAGEGENPPPAARKQGDFFYLVEGTPGMGKGGGD